MWLKESMVDFTEVCKKWNIKYLDEAGRELQEADLRSSMRDFDSKLNNGARRAFCIDIRKFMKKLIKTERENAFANVDRILLWKAMYKMTDENLPHCFYLNFIDCWS
jgi:hypothetical protein